MSDPRLMSVGRGYNDTRPLVSVVGAKKTDKHLSSTVKFFNSQILFIEKHAVASIANRLSGEISVDTKEGVEKAKKHDRLSRANPVEDLQYFALNEMSGGTVIVTNSAELLNTLQYYAKNQPKKIVHVRLKSGNYKLRSPEGVLKAFPITNLKNISIEAIDVTKKPRIARITLTTPENVHFKNIDFGIDNKKEWQHKDKNQTAISINAGNNISIDNADISGMYDGVSLKGLYDKDHNLSKRGENFTLKNSEIHDLRRDGITSVDNMDTYILDNEFRAFHPNYENYDRSKYGKNGKGTVFLTKQLIIKADHADITQFTNQEGDLIIKHNVMSAEGGAFVQGIFIHNENKGNSDKKRNANIVIEDNIIKNNHEIGIAIHGQTNKYTKNNKFFIIKSKGRKDSVEPKIDRNYGGYNNK